MRGFITVDRLTKQYGSALALDSISLEIERGEFIALLGPSGCGKTTLLRCLAGFIEPQGGKIFIDGQSMTGKRPSERPVNTVFQNYALFPHYTVAENVAFGPRRRSVPRKEVSAQVDQALLAVGMQDFASRYPGQLSGGQQQRVALARAIINRPKVLLLDEPLGALDLKLRKALQDELKRLHTTLGITFVYVTHDQEEALAMADRIVVMQAGQIAQIGTGEEIYLRPKSRYVADFVGDANILPCSVEGNGNVMIISDNVVVAQRSNPDRAASYALLIRPENLEIADPDYVGPSLYVGATVERFVFMGESSRVYVRSVGGHNLVLHVSMRSGNAKPQVGDRVAVRWNSNDAVLLTK